VGKNGEALNRKRPFIAGLLLSTLLSVGSVQAHTANAQTSTLPQGLLENKAIDLPAAGGEIALSLNKGKVEAGLTVVRAKKGATVVIKVQSKSVDELHLHGYDLRLPLNGTSPGELRIHALKTGRFEMESHTTHRPVLILEVRP
jgi:FtsP/CotA-like multicopper oxidase with cupredoxin domain